MKIQQCGYNLVNLRTPIKHLNELVKSSIEKNHKGNNHKQEQYHNGPQYVKFCTWVSIVGHLQCNLGFLQFLLTCCAILGDILFDPLVDDVLTSAG